MQADILKTILKDSQYDLAVFEPEDLQALSNRLVVREVRGKQTILAECIIREKEVVMKPEEVIRQLFTGILVNRYQYSKRRIAFEHPIHFGREVKRADIVVFDKDRPTVEYIICEIKKPKLLDGKNQLKSYTNATGAPIAVWTNGGQISYYNRKDPNYFEDISDIPTAFQTLADVIKERFTLKDLIIKDKLPNEGKSLKELIKEMEDEVLANAGVDVFEEVFKLIFTKLFDEHKSRNDKTVIGYFLNQMNEDDHGDYEKVKTAVEKVDDSKFRVLEFRNTGQSEGELKAKIQSLFDDAKRQWAGVFSPDSRITLTPSHLSICVSSLQNVKLFNSNLQIVDEAFEYLVNKSSKGEKGQYFTPRHVIDMCVKMLNPKRGEYMIDPAAGSCGFPVHTIFQMTGHLFSAEEISEDEKQDVLKVFGLDFDEKAVRVARTLNLIAGDGETNVLHLNTLDYERWDETTSTPDWQSAYGKGYNRLKERQSNKTSTKTFLFDLLMANPPFAGDIKESRIIHKYDLGFNKSGKPQSKVGRDILFIERNLDFLKPGGRMAIVLPQGRFNNTSDKQIRDFIAARCRILAVVGLHGNSFKPHTGTKTSVLFVQKWSDEEHREREGFRISLNNGFEYFLSEYQIMQGYKNWHQKYEKNPCRQNLYDVFQKLANQVVENVENRNPMYWEQTKQGILTKLRQEYIQSEFSQKYNYPIFFAVSQKAGKDNSGEYKYVPNGNGERKLDKSGHFIVDHDLHNHGGELLDGIAEAFIEFAKREKLSFWKE